MRILSVIIMIIFCAMLCFADQRYNEIENRWETVPYGNDWSLKQNKMNNKNDWSYQPNDSANEYNEPENKWDWNSGNNPESEEN